MHRVAFVFPPRAGSWFRSFKIGTATSRTRISKIVKPRYLRLTAFVLAPLFLFASCEPVHENDAQRLAKDTKATAELNRINTLLASQQPVTKLDVDSLINLRKEHPNSSVVRQLLQGALLKREDWAAAEELLSQVSDAERSRVDKLNLARIYIKQGRFAEATEFLKEFEAEDRDRVEVAVLLGQAQFYMGELDAATRSLESVRNDLLVQKRGDGLALLGTIYFRRGDNAKAIDTLQKTVDLVPENIAANNVLSRAYAAVGDGERSQMYRTKLEAINQRRAIDEKKKSRLVPLLYQLEAAYETKQYEQVIALVERIQPDADANTKPILYQYLAAAYTAMGEDDGAKRALAEAEKLTRK